ncbi:nucleoside triphosphate pyrophosphohydrolase [Halobacillus hunanensis]|uniref:nucleoside triphosphate pyrophosphohydrolase n=1 Tax=Halobacillus hunanensis TaxID=578214 RepID=UPI0009A74507|nr:nucleoside triphosphate pyrophosphohydrolase [Halobacillus hunanensis]
MPVYNKLVRDRIPEITEKDRKEFETKILDDKEYIDSLKEKLQEELNEYLIAENDEEALKEMADLLELMHALANVHGESMDKVEEIRKDKAEKRGAFKEQIYLVEVQD